MRSRNTRRGMAVAAVLVSGGLVLAGCGGSDSEGGKASGTSPGEGKTECAQLTQFGDLSGKSVKNVRADLARGGLPRNEVQVFVTDLNGRGTVNVVQQPSSYNNYTAVIRVYDPRPGYGDYSFDLNWRDSYSNRR